MAARGKELRLSLPAALTDSLPALGGSAERVAASRETHPEHGAHPRHKTHLDTIRSDNGADTMADSQKTGGNATYTFPHDFVVNGDFRPHAERLTGTIFPWTTEAVPATGDKAETGARTGTGACAETGAEAAAETGARAGTGAGTEAGAEAAAEPGIAAGAEMGAAATAKKGAQERVWVITNMKADGRTIVEGKVFVQDSGAIVGMEFAGEINHIAFTHIQALCAMASEVAGGHEIEKVASRSMSSTGGAGRRAKGEARRLELPPPYTRTERKRSGFGSNGNTKIDYKGDPDHETARGRSADSFHVCDDIVVVNLNCAGSDQEERVFHGAKAIARSEAAIRAWMEADEPWPGNAG